MIRAAQLPLSGITIVSIEQAIAAPLAARHLADWGARVIKIERPDAGDFCRDYDKAMNGMSSQFVWTNRSKESLAIDLKSEAGMQVFRALLPKADVVLQNLAPGAAARLGVDAATLVAQNPRLIACDISGYGSDGPYSHKKAYDLLVQCETGVLDINGAPEHPAKVGLSIVDIATGIYVLNGILMGLFHRERTGKGFAFEVSLFDAITEWMSCPAYYAQGAGQPLQRTGTRHASIAPYGPYRVGDGGQIFFGIQNQREWRRFCEDVLEDKALADDPRFADNPTRLRHNAELTGVIEAHLARFSADAACSLLERVGIANARLNTTFDFLKHPQLEMRNRITEVQSPCGPLMSFLPAITIPGMTPRMGPVPALGEHTSAILRELGLDEERSTP